MLDKKQAKVIFDATNQNSGMFDTFYQILSDAYSSSSKLEELVGQILNIINNPKSVLFHAKSGSLYEYKPLKESKEALKCVYDIAKQIESLIDTKYLLPLASNSDRPIQEICDKMTKTDEFVLKTKARASAQKMFDFQNDLLKKEQNEHDIKNKLQDEFNKKLASTAIDFVKNTASQAIEKQNAEFKKKLDKWKKTQLNILENKLTSMVPNNSYYFAYGGNKVKKISPRTGKQQAKELAEKIVELVYQKRLDIFTKFKKQPWGGQIGNMRGGWFGIVGEMECADWADLFYNGLEENIKKYYQKNLNSFRVEWRNIAPWLYNHFEHNYIRILGSNKGEYLVIDPWESGGDKIVPKSEKTGTWRWQGNYLYNDEDNIYAYPKEDGF